MRCVVVGVQALEGLTRPHLDAVAHACQVPPRITTRSIGWIIEIDGYIDGYTRHLFTSSPPFAFAQPTFPLTLSPFHLSLLSPFFFPLLLRYQPPLRWRVAWYPRPSCPPPSVPSTRWGMASSIGWAWRLASRQHSPCMYSSSGRRDGDLERDMRCMTGKTD